MGLVPKGVSIAHKGVAWSPVYWLLRVVCCVAVSERIVGWVRAFGPSPPVAFGPRPRLQSRFNALGGRDTPRKALMQTSYTMGLAPKSAALALV